MKSPAVQNEQSSNDQATFSSSSWYAGIRTGNDWGETGWFLEREKDELAGYLFADDCEMREGSD